MSIDHLGRTIDYLRISVTDRCNLRCLYCMPEEGVPWKEHDSLLSLEEIERFVAVAAQDGISRIRLTGGEPLVRPGIAGLISAITKIPGIERVALTTNGILLPKMAQELKEAGLSRVNISLDTLDPEQYTYITRRGKLEDALAGIEAALEYGFAPVKINCVVVRSLHQDVLAYAKLSIDRPLHIRFIEYMPVGTSSGGEGHGWTADDTVPSDELIGIINDLAAKDGLGTLEPVAYNEAPGGWGPARYYRFPGAQGTVGFISPLSNHFCGECNRLRLTADGKLRPCLFSDEEFDVKTALRTGTDDDVRDILRHTLGVKPDEHHDRVGTERTMSQIGG
ncbi:MAG: GTP 3',8-cyclase MoaA [Actinobacteria bacterium]|nr:GTP 3',8-cyclase MoaA [Actinomycetota bacterium]